MATLLLVAAGTPVVAQDYTLRVDARVQSVRFRGLTLDSIPAGNVLTAPQSGPQTPDGHAVRCAGGPYCYFFRPGPELHGIPATTTVSTTLWGFGVEGLSLRATGRMLADLGADDVWPGTEPSAQLIEGYFEYERPAVVARAGRQFVSSRLEHLGFDGGLFRGRWDRASLELTGYAGWGLGQAAAVPATSPALNPLDEWRPRDRQTVAGAEVAWFWRSTDVRAEYRREKDPEDHAFVSERAAFSFGTYALALRFTGGFDYNIAEGHLGSGDLNASLIRERFSVSAGARRYRPYFSLWTLWGAFSPVPYHAVSLSGQVRPYRWLRLHARGERYRYDDAEVTTALVPQLEDRGWRTRIGAMASARDQWFFDAQYGVERGPGASSRFTEASISYAPGDRYSIDLYGGTLARPLELRFYDARSRWIGGRAQWQIDPQRRVWADVAHVGDDRDRPDAGASSLSQTRMRAGVTLTFGTRADRAPLPPARRPAP
jgi:hypothetical protein